MCPQLTIRSHGFNPVDLAAWPGVSTLGDFSDNERQALAFCRRWLEGVEEFVVHTSGSTGAPKPIALRRAQMVASALATGEALGLAAGMRALVCLPIRYIAGQMMLVRGLVLDLALTLVEPAADPLVNLPVDQTFDVTALVPPQLQALLEGPDDRLDRLNRMHAILVGGGPVSATLERKLQAVSAPIYHTYGMTETATHVALRRLNGADASPFFQPLPGVALGVDERGCLRIIGPMTSDRWLQTNDLVELSPPPSPPSTLHPSLFRWLGRWDTVINSGGVKVQVERVEAALERALHRLGLHDRRFFVGPLPEERMGQVVAAIFEGEPLGDEAVTAIQTVLRAELDRFSIPRRFVYLPELIETPTGKIDRQASLREATQDDGL